MAIVNKIIHSSVVDGPGNRAAVFLQKCNFKCSYCHNPETIGQCVQCGACVEKCPAKALSLKDGKIVWDEDKCCECDTCIHVCPHISTSAPVSLSCRISMTGWKIIENPRKP